MYALYRDIADCGLPPSIGLQILKRHAMAWRRNRQVGHVIPSITLTAALTPKREAARQGHHAQRPHCQGPACGSDGLLWTFEHPHVIKEGHPAHQSIRVAGCSIGAVGERVGRAWLRIKVFDATATGIEEIALGCFRSMASFRSRVPIVKRMGIRVRPAPRICPSLSPACGNLCPVKVPGIVTIEGETDDWNTGCGGGGAGGAGGG